MARITEFFHDTRNCRPHQSTVECGWQVISDGREQLLQLATFGSDARKSEKKVSQTIQIDAQAAGHLRRLLEAHFPG